MTSQARWEKATRLLPGSLSPAILALATQPLRGEEAKEPHRKATYRWPSAAQAARCMSERARRRLQPLALEPPNCPPAEQSILPSSVETAVRVSNNTAYILSDWVLEWLFFFYTRVNNWNKHYLRFYRVNRVVSPAPPLLSSGSLLSFPLVSLSSCFHLPVVPGAQRAGVAGGGEGRGSREITYNEHVSKLIE